MFRPAPSRFETYLAAILRRLQRARTYPREARRLGLEGTVGLAFSIELDGSASRIEVVPGAVPILAAAARRLVADRPLLPPPAGWSPAARVRLVLTYLLE